MFKEKKLRELSKLTNHGNLKLEDPVEWTKKIIDDTIAYCEEQIKEILYSDSGVPEMWAGSEESIPKDKRIEKLTNLLKQQEQEIREETKDWYYEGDELVIKKGKWIIDRYKKHIK